MDKKKIDQVGQKVHTTNQDFIHVSRRKRKIKQILFLAYQKIVITLTFVWGVLLNYQSSLSAVSTYPYASGRTFFDTYTLTNLPIIAPFHILNGGMVIPDQNWFALKRNSKLIAFFITLVLSLLAYIIAYLVLPPLYTNGVRYGVYHKKKHLEFSFE